MSAELKALQVQENALVGKLKQAENEMRELSKTVTELKSKLTGVQAGIKRLVRSNEGVIISEHAILRYLQHVRGLDLDEVRQEMLPSKVESQIKLLGGGRFPCSTHDLRVKSGVVVTVTPKN